MSNQTEHLISGIQQVGIGVPDVHEAWKWYRQHLGVNIPIFEERAEANLMLPYTGGKPHHRHAILAINGQGGGGLEIWQYTSRKPQPPGFEVQLGDLGINMIKYKSRNIRNSYDFLKSKGTELMGDLTAAPSGKKHFYLKDRYGNWIELIESKEWFHKNGDHSGGVYGVVIGVSDVERALPLYRDILGYDVVVYDEEGTFEDFSEIPGGRGRFRRMLLGHSEARKGSFSPMLGNTVIELVQSLDRKPRKILENRYWGDLGYIHLCYDVRNMPALRDYCAAKGHPFTVDSSADREVFDMGEAAGNFAYIEDPDGTLIEFVEAYKIPIVKKLGWYLNLRKRHPEKPLPRWMLRALALNKKKD